MKWSFHPAALEEYEAAVAYYEERDPAVALKFQAMVEQATRRVVEAPERWRAVDGDIRRCLTHAFPYALLYTAGPDGVLILCVAHCSREPGYWKERLGAEQKV